MPEPLILNMTLPAELDNLDRFIEAAAALARRFGFDEAKVLKIELALEEAIVNIIRHAYAGAKGPVNLTGRAEMDQSLVIEISDQGQPFNLLALPEPDLTSDLARRPIGGLGVHFIRRIADQVRYERKSDRNVLTLVFHRNPLGQDGLSE
ncbi:MAG: ATP-binding protein [Thermodesulfobacteriota bacterium]